MKLKRKIELFKIQKQPFQATIETVGHLEAEGQTDIAAGVSGVVDDVLFREGQWVDRDSLLVRIDQKRHKANYDSALALEKKAETAFNLSRDLEGLTRLAGIGSSAEDRVRAAGSSKLAESEYAQAKAARQLAENNFNRSQVKAPYSGQINQRKVTVGSYLEDKTVIATIANLSQIRLVGYIPEKSAPGLRAILDNEEFLKSACLISNTLFSPINGLVISAADESSLLPFGYQMRFTLRALPRENLTARLFYISSVASPDTHMFECKGLIDHSSLSSQLRPGYTAKIICDLPGKKDALVVPEEAVRASEKGFIIFQPMPRVIADGSIEWVAKPRTLQLGLRKPGIVEILEGAREGDWVVRKGADALEDGTPVDVPKEMEAELLKKIKENKGN
ncbi:MAG: efflux RND transporter periplasmic adaptor subunit [Gemmataceae bacterium]